MRIRKPVLILLLLFLAGCGRKENAVENEAENKAESAAGNGENASMDTKENDEDIPTAEGILTMENENEASISEKPAIIEETSPQYPLITTSPHGTDFVLVSEGTYCIFDGEKYGFITEDGEEIAPCIYDIAYPFSEGLACVCKDGKYGYIDLTGETVIPFTYDRATPFAEGLAYFATGEDYGFIDKTGTQVFALECDSVSSFREGLAYFSIDGRYGYIDQGGQIVIEPVFDYAAYFQDGLVQVMQNGRYGVINRKGELIVAAEYDSIEIGDSFINACVDEKYTCFDRTGKALLEQYDDIRFSTGENYIYIQKGEKYGLADKNGNVLFEPMYDMISLLPGENFLRIRENELYGIVDLQGEFRIPAVYSDIRYDSYDRKADAAEDGMLVLTDADGHVESMNIVDFSEKIPCVYDSIVWISHDRAVVEQDGLSGIIDREGNLIEPIAYAARIMSDGAVWLRKDKGAKFYTNKGEAVDIDDYDGISKTGNCYQVEKNGMYGFLNEEGEEVCPLIYDYIRNDRIFGADNILFSWGSENDFIIKTGEAEQVYITNAILQNEITPRIRPYREFTENGNINIVSIAAPGGSMSIAQEELREYHKTYALFDFDNTGEPILYFEAAPYIKNGFPMSYSGFYMVRDNQLVEIDTGYECGGSLRGDFACFWYDKETSRILLGTNGVWGGFPGNIYAGEIYDRKDGEIVKIASLECFILSLSDFDEEELSQPELVYNLDGEPFTKEGIEQAESGTMAVVHYINDNQTTIEKYQEMDDRYRMIIFL
ncbi:MAG: WG repeat-containing protein [Bacillus sp. (in: Bacteria)]|nr:WG repeat-containing protein [Bacillus sp. (in: firmicutes)]MCM1427792.1 WG repeat-containing protein [Eubacterium sp.]